MRDHFKQFPSFFFSLFYHIEQVCHPSLRSGSGSMGQGKDEPHGTWRCHPERSEGSRSMGQDASLHSGKAREFLQCQQLTNNLPPVRIKHNKELIVII